MEGEKERERESESERATRSRKKRRGDRDGEKITFSLSHRFSPLQPKGKRRSARAACALQKFTPPVLAQSHLTKSPPKKLNKKQSIERAFVADPVGALPAAAAAAAAAPLRPESALDAATAEYLAHAGRFAAAKELVLEAGLFQEKKDGDGGEEEEEAGRAAAGERAAEALVAPFVEAEAALSMLRFPRCDAEPALAWLASKRRAMMSKKKKKKRREAGAPRGPTRSSFRCSGPSFLRCSPAWARAPRCASSTRGWRGLRRTVTTRSSRRGISTRSCG